MGVINAGAHLALFDALTGRERDVLRLLALGLSPRDVATVSFVSIATVRTHIAGILAKLGVASVTGAVVAAYRTGWVAV